MVLSFWTCNHPMIGWNPKQDLDNSQKHPRSAHFEFLSFTFSSVEDCSWFATLSLPVDTVRERTNKIFLCALHHLLPHLMELLGIVDAAVELCTGIWELCRKKKQCTHRWAQTFSPSVTEAINWHYSNGKFQWGESSGNLYNASF